MAAPAGDWFVDRAAASGLDFVHFNGATGAFHYPELLPPGVGLLDYDGDGDLDAFLVQGGMLDPALTPGDALIPPRAPLPLTARLYRNDLAAGSDGSPTLRFTDVTAESGIAAGGYGLGVAAGDVNNDGWTDLFLTDVGSNRLYLNAGDGTFRDGFARERHRGGDGVRRLGRVRRLRPGRLARSLRGTQRRLHAGKRDRLRDPGRRARLLPARDVRRHARSPVPQPRRRTVRGPSVIQRSPAADSARRSASPRPISTATAGATSTSPTTGPETCSGSISATAPSATSGCCRARR